MANRVSSEAMHAVNDVMMYLCNRKRTAVDALFAEACEDYKAEWLARDPARFWCALDLANRRRLVQRAVDFYARESAEG